MTSLAANSLGIRSITQASSYRACESYYHALTMNDYDCRPICLQDV